MSSGTVSSALLSNDSKESITQSMSTTVVGINSDIIPLCHWNKQENNLGITQVETGTEINGTNSIIWRPNSIRQRSDKSGWTGQSRSATSPDY